MLVGYARTSTLEQKAGFDAQKRELKDAGCEKVFAEQVSSVAARPVKTHAGASGQNPGQTQPRTDGQHPGRWQ